MPQYVKAIIEMKETEISVSVVISNERNESWPRRRRKWNWRKSKRNILSMKALTNRRKLWNEIVEENRREWREASVCEESYSMKAMKKAWNKKYKNVKKIICGIRSWQKLQWKKEKYVRRKIETHLLKKIIKRAWWREEKRLLWLKPQCLSEKRELFESLQRSLMKLWNVSLWEKLK